MIAAPASHSYLGADLLEIPSPLVLEAGEGLVVPLLRLSGVVLFPGEALPLRITDSCYINYFRQASNARGNPTGAGNTAGTIIGVMCQLPDREDLSTLGTLAEVCSMQCTADEVRLLARGRHRFKLLESHRDGGVLQARVQVLEELEVRPRTAVESRPFPRWVYDAHDPVVLLQRVRVLLEQIDALRGQDEGNRVNDRSDQQSYRQILQDRVVEWAHLAMEGASSASESANESYSGDETRDEDSLGCEDQSTAMSIGEDSIDILLETAEDGPPAENTCNTVTSTVSNTAMTLHSVEYLITTAPQESDATALQESDAPIADETVEIANNDELICVKVDKINKSMEDPNAMSYRIAANLVLPDDVRQGLLDSPNAVLRLRMIIQILEDSTSKDVNMMCATCGLALTSRKKLCKVPGAEGEIGAYVNPHGVVHQTVTFSSLNPRAAVLYGYPEERDTWFPGYAWTIACCRLCGDHIGWKFTAIENESIDAVQGLRVFWGLRRSALAGALNEH